MKRALTILGERSLRLPMEVGTITNFPLGMGLLMVLVLKHEYKMMFDKLLSL